MSGLNLKRRGVENTISLYHELDKNETIECKVLMDWLAMYDLLKEIAELLHKWEKGKFYTSISSKDLRSRIRTLIGGE